VKGYNFSKAGSVTDLAGDVDCLPARQEAGMESAERVPDDRLIAAASSIGRAHLAVHPVYLIAVDR
jgi:hypothetical protein